MVTRNEPPEPESFSNIIDATPVSIQIVGADGLYRYVNQATISLFRAKAKTDFIGQSPFCFYPPMQSDGKNSEIEVQHYIRRGLAGEVITFEWDHQRHDGTIFPCLVTLQQIPYEGEPGLMATIVDISETSALRKKSEFIITNAPSPILDINPDLTIRAANNSFSVLTELSIVDMKKMKLTDFVVQNRMGGSLSEALESQSSVIGEMDVVVKSGVKSLRYQYTPFYDAYGSLISIIAYYYNKTEEKQAVRDIVSLTERCQAGALDSRLDISKYQGELKTLTDGINNTLDSVIGPLNVAAEYVDRIAKGDIPPKITETYNGDFNEIKNNLNTCIDAVNLLVSESTVLTDAAVSGKLSTRADASRHQGDFRKIMEGVNKTLDAVTSPLREAGEILGQIAVNDHTASMDEGAFKGEYGKLAGDINGVLARLRHITESIVKIGSGDLSDLEVYKKIGRRSEQDKIIPGFIKTLENLQSLSSDTRILTKAGIEGKLDTRADASRHEGEYRTIVEGLNATVDAMADKVVWYESILDAVQFPIHVTDMGMKWTYMNKAFEDVLLKNKVITDRRSAYGLPCHTADATICRTENCGIDQLRKKGVTESFFEWQGMSGKQVTKPVMNARGQQVGYVETVQDLTEQLNQIAYYESILDAVPMAITVTDLDSKWTFVNKAVEKMLNRSRRDLIGHPCNEWGANICNTDNCGVKRLKAGVENTMFEQDGGHYKVDCAYISNLKGEKVGHVEVVGDITGITKVSLYLREEVNHLADNLKKIGKGDINCTYDVTPPDEHTNEVAALFVAINESLKEATSAISLMIADAKMLSTAAVEGKLDTRADVSHHQGEYRTIVEGVNQTLDSVMSPVKEALRVSREYSNYQFRARIDPSLNMSGDWIEFKQALDNIGVQISAAVGLINQQLLALASNAEEATASIEEVSAGAQQIAQSAGGVSRNAELGNDGITQVLKAMEDLNITVGEVSQRAEQVSTAAVQANEYSKMGVDLARKSESSMTEITQSTTEVDTIVKEINTQMEEIGKIVRLISDIANQTNLLALNAAIEAARAGDAGRGFAVVAAEVKSLAQDSRKSAENIADMISSLQNKAQKASIAMTRAGETVAGGSKSLSETMGAFTRIDKSIDDITRNAMDVASASEEQAASVEEVTASIHEVSGLIISTSSEAGDAAAATEEASASIEQISKVVSNVSGIADSVSREMSKFVI